MAISLKQMIDRFTKMEKAANETLAADPKALVGVESIPGAEHDAKVPEEAKKPDSEVAQGQPAGAASTSGAVVGGDAKPLNEGKLEMDQAVTNPEKKPLISDDALSAKTANEHLTNLVNDLLADINGKAEKKAESCGSEGGEGKKEEPAKTEAKEEKKEDGEKKAAINKISLDDETISKLAAAQAAYMIGHSKAEETIKQAGDASEARKLIKAACVKAAQEQGLDPAAAEAAAENAMAAAGVPAEAAVPVEAAAGDAAAAQDAAGAAAADAGAAEAAAGEDAIPEDVTEEELATAIVDLVNSGELDADTAKALVEEIAGDEGAAPTEDQAAEIIAQGLESGEITPEQAQQIAAAVESGAGAAAADAEAQGAADAAAAAEDAKDEAAGAAAAEEAMKQAAEKIRSETISKVASAIVAKRQTKQAAAEKEEPVPGSRVMDKVASILKAKKAEKTEKQASAPTDDEAKYIAGFCKKASEMGVDPAELAKYILANQK